MLEPLFKVGDLVRVQGNISLGPGEVVLDAYEVTSTIGMAPGVFEASAILPEEGGQRQYRIKGGEHGHERVVREVQLVHASKPSPGGSRLRDNDRDGVF
jgi:hypothetical protein